MNMDVGISGEKRNKTRQGQDGVGEDMSEKHEKLLNTFLRCQLHTVTM